MYHKFEKLEVWRLSRVFVSKIYLLTRDYPKTELFGLISQLRRVAISILLNIAGGSARQSDIEFRRYLIMSLASLEEVVSAMYISLDQKFINQEKFNTIYEESHALAIKIKSFINFLSK